MIHIYFLLIHLYLHGWVNGDSFYGVLTKNHSLAEYTVSGTTNTIINSSESESQSSVGLACYEPTNYRYYYLYQNHSKTPIETGIASFDLFNNVSLNAIPLNEYFTVDTVRNLENAFLLLCNPNNGDLYVLGTSKLDSQTMDLYLISFKNNNSLPYNETLSYTVTKIRQYLGFNTLQNDSYLSQPHIYDPIRNTFWFAHYYGNDITSNNWIWYNINPMNGAILHEKSVVHSPNFTYLDYNIANDKLIGAKIDTVNGIYGTMTVNVYNPIDFSLFYSMNDTGIISNFYPCNGGNGVSIIDSTNNIWYIINDFISSIDINICDVTVISAIDISNIKSYKYINSSLHTFSRDTIMLSLSPPIEYYSIMNASVTINNEIINVTSDEFVSYTIDIVEIVRPYELNLSDPQLIYMTSQLAPSIMRVGGTEGDYTYYQVGAENPCNLPTNASHSYYCYSMGEFENLVSFAHKVNASLVFGLSMGYPLFPTSDESYWNDSNTRQFLQYIHDILGYTNDDIWGFELGNELSNHPYTDAEPQAYAFLTLSKLISDIWRTDDPFYFKLLGFDNAGHTLYGQGTKKGNFTYYPVFVNITCPVLYGLTYHVYIAGDANQILEPQHLDKQWYISNKVSQIFSPQSNSNYNLCADNKTDFVRISHNVIAGEIAYHAGSTAPPGLLDSYLDGFWYIDCMGLLGNLGHAYFFRQTLANNGYGLLPLTRSFYKPHTDYFTAVLAKNLLSNKVINVYSNQQHLRIYGRCLNTKYPMRQINNLLYTNNGIVLLYLNLFFRVTKLEFDASIVKNTTQIYLWSLTSTNVTHLNTLDMEMNGVKLELDKYGKVPNLNGKLMPIDIPNNAKKFNMKIPQTSYGFIVFTQTNIDACE